MGATNGLSGRCFVVEGMIIGRWARSFRSCLQSLVYIFIYDKLGEGAVLGDVQDDAAASVVFLMSLILLGIGMVVGLISSFMSVTNI